LNFKQEKKRQESTSPRNVGSFTLMYKLPRKVSLINILKGQVI